MTPERIPSVDARLEIEQSLRIIVQRLQDLAHRVDFLESALLPGVAAPTEVDAARATAARRASVSLASDLESIGSALGSVMSSIESSKAVPTPPPVERVVDLSSARRASVRLDPNRPSGWQPVTKKPSQAGG